MPLSNVSSWTAEQVSEWIGGLDDAISQYGDKVKENEITGTKLLALSRQDLEKLEVVKVGHQELFLESVQLLHKLPKEKKTEESLKTLVSSFTENIESALNKVREGPDAAEEGPLPEGVLQVLPPVTSIAKGLVSLLSRYPYSVVKQCNQLREKICKKAESITKQAEKLNALNEDCKEFLSGSKEKVISHCFTVETAVLNTEGHTAGLGLSFSTGSDHLHIVSGIHAKSPASMSEKIDIGDEILQISEQVVVGWQQDKVAELLKSQPNSFSIMVKKLPGEHVTESTEPQMNGIHEPNKTIESNEPQTLTEEKHEEVPEQKKPVNDGDAVGGETVQNDKQAEKQADKKLDDLSPEDSNGVVTEEHKEQTHEESKENAIVIKKEETNEESKEVTKEETKEESTEIKKEVSVEVTKEETKEETKEIAVEVTKEESKEMQIEVTKEESKETVIETEEQVKEICKIETKLETEVVESVSETDEEAIVKEGTSDPGHKEEPAVQPESADETTDNKKVDELESAAEEQEAPAIAIAMDLKDEKEKVEETEVKEAEAKEAEAKETEEKQRAVTLHNPEDSKEIEDKTGKVDEPTSPVRRTKSFDGKKVDETPLSSTTWYVDNDGEPLEEAVDSSTTIVGGVGHNVPMNSGNSPKAAAKSPKKKSKQETPEHHRGKLKLAFGSLFGKKKSKSPATSPERKAADFREKQETAEKAPSEPPSETKVEGKTETVPVETVAVAAAVKPEETNSEKENVEEPAIVEKEQKVEQSSVEPAGQDEKAIGQAEEPDKPAEETTKPVEEPVKPAEESAKPAEEPTKPSEEPTEPAEEPTKPAEEPTKPAEEPVKPAEEPAKPAEEATKPAEEATGPADEPTKPTEGPIKSTEEPEKPADEPTKSAEEPTKPSEEPTEPAEEPTKPAEEPSKPAEEPTKPAEEPVKPAEEPAKPAEEPTKTSEEPSKPADEPTKPAEDPAKSDEEPTKSTEEPTKPAEEPTNPVEEPSRSGKDSEQNAADSASPGKQEKEPHQSKFKKVWGSLFKGKRSKSISKEHPDSKDEKGEHSESAATAGDKGEVTGQPTNTEAGSKPTPADQTEPDVVVSTVVPPESVPVPPSEEKADEAATKTESSPADGGGEKKGEATEQQTNAATAEKTTVPDVQDPSKEKKVEEVDAVKAEVAVFEQAPPNQPQEPVAAVGEGKKPEQMATESPKSSRGTPASSPLSGGEAPQDEDSVLRERIARQKDSPAAGSHSPKAPPRMNMRISYAEKNEEGTLEVEVHGEVVRRSEDEKRRRGPAENRISCVELGETDHKGWLTKKSSGGLLAHWSWKRKWIVLKDQKLYYYKTSFDAVAGGVIHLDGAEIALAPEIKKPLCFKVEHSQIKTGKMYFIADNQNDLDLWLKILKTASKGEPIIKPSPSNVVRLDVGHDQRRRSGSTGMRPKHSGSVLGVGAANQDYHDEKTDENKQRPRRASHGSKPQDTSQLDRTDSQGKKRETEASLEDTAGQVSQQPVVVVEPPSSPKSEPETTEAAEKQATQTGVQVETMAKEKEETVEEKKEERKAEDEVPSEEKKEDASSPAEEKKEEITEVAPEPAVTAVEATASETTPDNTESASSAEAEQAAQAPEPPAAVEVTSETPVSEAAPSTAEPSELQAPLESSTAVSDVVTQTEAKSKEGVESQIQPVTQRDETLARSGTDVTEVDSHLAMTPVDSHPAMTSVGAEQQEETDQTKNKEETTLVSGIKAKVNPESESSSSVENVSASPTSSQAPSTRSPTGSKAPSTRSPTGSRAPSTRSPTGSRAPSITTWFYILDTNDDSWSVNKSHEDEMKSLYRSIKDAKVSILGERVLEPPDRLRAMTSAGKSGSGQQILQLTALQRVLKDKEEEEEAVEELISQGVDRQSVSSWKEKYPHLSGYVEGSEEEKRQDQPQSEGADDQVSQLKKVDGEAPQPEKIESQELQPEKVDGQVPEADDVEDKAPQADDVDGQAPQPEVDGQAPQPENVDGLAPEPEKVNGQVPQPEKVDSQASQPAKVDGEAPQPEKPPQQAQETNLDAQDTHL